MGGVPRKLHHFSRLRARVCPIQKSRRSFGKKREKCEQTAEEREKDTKEQARCEREDMCLAALDKIASLLIKRRRRSDEAFEISGKCACSSTIMRFSCTLRFWRIHTRAYKH